MAVTLLTLVKSRFVPHNVQRNQLLAAGESETMRRPMYPAPTNAMVKSDACDLHQLTADERSNSRRGCLSLQDDLVAHSRLSTPGARAPQRCGIEIQDSIVTPRVSDQERRVSQRKFNNAR